MECLQPPTYKICSAWLLFFTLDIALGGNRASSAEDVNKHLALGGQFLARGDLQEALTHYHAAVEGDPHNYLTYFKRGTVYLALGKAKQAITDLNKVLELKPDFIGARYQRGQVFLKQGSLNEAMHDYYNVMAAGFNDFDMDDKDDLDVLQANVINIS